MFNNIKDPFDEHIDYRLWIKNKLKMMFNHQLKDLICLHKGNKSKPFNQFLDNNHYFQLKEVDQSAGDE